MAKGRKMRADSFAAHLSEAQRAQLCNGLESSRLSYDEAVEAVTGWVGRPVSETAIRRWYRTQQPAMTAGRKLRADSFAARLNEDQRDELMHGLWTSALSYADAAVLVSEYGAGPVSESALRKWFHTHQLAWRMQRAKLAGIEAEKNAPADLDERARAAIGYQKMVAMLGGELAPKDIVAFERNELARRKQELDERRLGIDERKLALLEKKAAAADAAKGLAEDQALTAQEKSDRLKEIFGIR